MRDLLRDVLASPRPRAAMPDALFTTPEGQRLALDVAPRKESWDRVEATSQKELGRFLEHVEQLASPALAALTGPLGLRLDVGLASGIDPLFEHDLDNFLHPLVKRLGGERFACAWATKAPGEHSQNTGQIHSNGWGLSGEMNLNNNVAGWELVRFEFEGGGNVNNPSEFQMYNFWVDPRMTT